LPAHLCTLPGQPDGALEKLTKIILSLIARERATDASNVPQNASFLSLRAQIYALAFPFSRFREEMFAAHTAGRNLYDIIWIARGKPKAPTENERVISQFQKAIKNAPETEYTDDELRDPFERLLFTRP
jgi:hypothetical protein